MATNGEAAERPPPPSLPGPSRVGDFLGKHWLSASISRLNLEIQYLELPQFMTAELCSKKWTNEVKELNQLEETEPSSAACREVISSTEDKSDALLHVTPGPENPAWHRWFQRVRSSQSRKWWMHKGSFDVS